MTGCLHLSKSMSLDEKKLETRKKLDLRRNSFLFRGFVVWNYLDRLSREFNNIDNFKRQLKNSSDKSALSKSLFRASDRGQKKDKICVIFRANYAARKAYCTANYATFSKLF